MNIEQRQALIDLGRELKSRDYQFVTITPESHRRVIERAASSASALGDPSLSLRDIFGWSRCFPREALEPRLFELLQKASLLELKNSKANTELYKSRVRASTIHSHLYFHSAFPTDQEDSIFFGPDTYRFVKFLKSELPKVNHLIDIGCGSGAGGLELGDRCQQLSLSDINAKALLFSDINARVNGVENVQFLQSEVFAQIKSKVDGIISNPPFLMDASERAYRHGGQNFGTELSTRIVREGLEHLNSNGTLILYSASAFIRGVDVLKTALLPILKSYRCQWSYCEIDPDIFGEELSRPEYFEVERIAAVGLVVKMS